MMRKRYDLVIGMGMACSCSQALRRANLQLLAFPFDWVAPDTRNRRHLVRIERPDLPGGTPAADCLEARQILADGFPGVNFSLLQLVCDPSCPPPSRREMAFGDDILQISFDYRSKDPSAATYQPDLEILAEALADRFSVTDYRTREEIRRHKEALLRKKLAKAGCDTLLQLRWKKLKNSIRKRLGYL